MPILKNVRHELFAQGIARGWPACRAYREAGYTPSDANASRLRGNDKIQARIAEIQALAASRLVITVAKLQHDLEQAKEIARDGGNASAMVAAVREQAVLAGLRVEKTDSTQRYADADAVTDAQLLQIIADAEARELDNGTTGQEAGDGTRH